MDAQKAAAAANDSSASKKIEELSRDLQKKAVEIEQLKQRLKKYADYDEIKRELEIMKVGGRAHW